MYVCVDRRGGEGDSFRGVFLENYREEGLGISSLGRRLCGELEGRGVGNFFAPLPLVTLQVIPTKFSSLTGDFFPRLGMPRRSRRVVIFL